MALLLVTGLVFVSYFSVYYKAETYEMSETSVVIAEEKDHIALIPESYEDVFIFYPGAKVDAQAYVPLLKKCADKGILCLIVRPPFHFALFSADEAYSLKDEYPEGKHYYVGGHSLGGVCASICVNRHPSDFDGLILLASYSSSDLSSGDTRVLDIYGDRDEVLNMEKHEENKRFLPSDYEELLIKGGNHSQFGAYGFQKGDGKAAISEDEQKEMTAETIVSFIRE